ncbi:ATP phosphoribosyltransferase regulatory subunit [Rhodoblastus sphagnicola]|uniref:ATP phosphoribosyltransferase regulatory subunit n=1 Tax=Rhodoblastus sphagnicola TaxID=333368 RepID=A0A2S6N5H3_9HYPH|nr:ATP phosphoribosyltransferase regulatory subunit [Rhodoblastus sphagnicola]MBB4197255.1 ATP phosphoribosyltransferase regulatory subunit [Rhodoblastus sphagnicola]PPQ29861.1 ATP phosphoribosyltransferase regulatory subunit [Rhodoblastus sphagnicola]
MSAGQDNETFLRKLEAAGYRARDPAILQPASVFLDLSGEDMRGRLLLTSDGAREYCLRPEFTIPLSLAYLASPEAGEPAALCACGPVFRLGAGAKPEFIQAGLENFGRADREAADAEILALALETAGPGPWRVRMGDASLVSALLEKLELPAVWLRRIHAGLAKGQALGEIFNPRRDHSDHSGVLAALDGADKAGARALVEDLLKIADISALGGRTANEIAERFLEQAELRSSAGLDAAKRGLLEQFFAISGQPDQASAQLRALFAAAQLDLTVEMNAFDQRLNFLAARGIDLNTLEYSAGFARNLDYYTGFVFEASKGGDPVIGGGRYDRLLSTLGAKEDIPAVGAAIWMERL